MSAHNQQYMSVCATQQAGAYPANALGRGPNLVGPLFLVQQQSGTIEDSMFSTPFSSGCDLFSTGGLGNSANNSFTWSLPRDGSGPISCSSIPAQGLSCSMHNSFTTQAELQIAGYDSTGLHSQPALPAANISAQAVNGFLIDPPGLVQQCPLQLQPDPSMDFLTPGFGTGTTNSVTSHAVSQNTPLANQLIMQQTVAATTVSGGPMMSTTVNNSLTREPSQDATMFLSAIKPSAMLPVSAMLPAVATQSSSVSAPTFEQLQLQLLRQQNALLQQQLTQQKQQALQQQQQLEQQLQSLLLQSIQSGSATAPSTGLVTAAHRQLSATGNTHHPLSTEVTGQLVMTNATVVSGQSMTPFAYSEGNNQAVCSGVFSGDGGGGGMVNNKAAATLAIAEDAVHEGATASAQQQAPAAVISGPSLDLARSRSDVLSAAGIGHVVASKPSGSEAAAAYASILDSSAASGVGTGVFLRMNSAPVQIENQVVKHSTAKPVASVLTADKMVSSAGRQGSLSTADSIATGCSSDSAWLTSTVEEICAASLKRLSIGTPSSRHSSNDGLQATYESVERLPVPATGFASDQSIKAPEAEKPVCPVTTDASSTSSVQRCAPKWAGEGWDPKAQVVARGPSGQKGTGAFIPGSSAPKIVTGTGAFLPPAVKQAIAAAAACRNSDTTDSSTA